MLGSGFARLASTMMCRVGRVILVSGSPQLPIGQLPSSLPQPQSRVDVKLGWTRQSSSSWDNTQSQDGPLRGMRVLDLTRVLAGPFCTMLLGDLGAEVIKVEKPGSGDDTRTWGPPFMKSESVYFMSVNRNKKSITVNLKCERGQEIVRKLAQKSDILVENYMPGKLDELNMGYEQLKQLNPSLIYCSITGFGETGPYARRAGYDVIASAVAGLMHITGPKGGDPTRVGVAMTDLSTGLYAHGAIMAALMNRLNTGKGQKIQCNLLSSQVALLTHLACNYLNAGQEAQRWGTAHESIVPYQAFKTSDSWIVVGAGSNKQFQNLCERIGLSELALEDNYASNLQRVKHREELAFFDVRVFHPNAPSYRGLQLETCYRRHENEKRRAYEQRVREIENGSFTPLVFSTSGGMGKAAKITYNRLASLLSIKREQPYSLVMGWLRCRLSFSLLRSAVMCLRGCRSKKGHIPLSDTHIELVVHEGRLPLSS